MNEVQVAHLLAAGALLVGEDLSRLLSAMDRVGPKAVRHMIDGLEFARSRGHTVDLDYLTGWWASAKGDEHVDDDLFEILLNMHDREKADPLLRKRVTEQIMLAVRSANA